LIEVSAMKAFNGFEAGESAEIESVGDGIIGRGPQYFRAGERERKNRPS